MPDCPFRYFYFSVNQVLGTVSFLYTAATEASHRSTFIVFHPVIYHQFCCILLSIFSKRTKKTGYLCFAIACISHSVSISFGIYYIFFFVSILIAWLCSDVSRVYVIKKVLHWYFRRKISSNDIKLVKLRTEKKQLLEKVMETETYKVAKEILDKFDTEQQNVSSSLNFLRSVVI